MLVNLAVVTNVIPYIISLSALVVIMKNGRVPQGTYKLNTSVIAVIAMLYSTYAIYASGKDAVLGGTIVLALTYIIYGFIAPRFTGVVPPKPECARPRPGRMAAACCWPSPAARRSRQGRRRPRSSRCPTPAHRRLSRRCQAFLLRERVRQAGRLRVDVCQKVFEVAKAELGLADVQLSWVPVTMANRLELMRAKKIQLVCGEPVTAHGKEGRRFHDSHLPGRCWSRWCAATHRPA